MTSVPAEAAPKASLPPLAPVSAISRRLSLPEYYHASVGASRHTLDGPRLQIFVIRGHSTLNTQQWQRALDQVVACNPGLHLRLAGNSWWARWKSDGAPPRLRIVDDCDWDMLSEQGAGFIDAAPLSLRHGPNIELLVARRTDGSTLLILRCHHAVTDGIGSMHIYEELFRALRGEPLLGSNAGFSDTDLMLSVGARHTSSPRFKVEWLTGRPAGEETGDEWRRISLGPPGKNLLARAAAALAEFAGRHSESPALIGVPVNLRRHAPGLISTTNFSSMLRVPLFRGDGPEQFSQRLKEMLAQRMETFYRRSFDLFKLLPLSWIDRLLSRTLRNYRSRKAVETAVISNLGRFDAAALSCPGFQAERMFVLPIYGSVFSIMVCVGEQVEMTVGMPKNLAGNGRFDALVEHLKTRLAG
jgi:NRPS condensation-like uncharacterized protein